MRVALFRRRRRGAVAAAVTVVSDLFNRANNASSLGTADTGQVWSALAETWQILANQASMATQVSNGVAVVPTAVANCTVGVTATVAGTDNGVVGRATDINNYWRFIFESGTWFLQKTVAGARTTVNSIAGVSANNDRIELVMNGNILTGKVNGVAILSATDAFNASATSHGITAANTSIQYDNFAVTVP
jgi:hypothetical protein